MLLSASLVNYCIYCVVARSTVAAMNIEPGKVIEALQDGTMLPDPKLETLAALTLSNYVNHAADTVFVPMYREPRNHTDSKKPAQ